MSWILGGGAPQINYTPQGFKNPTGFSVSGKGNVSESPALTGAIGSLSSTFGQAAQAFGGLASTVQPGFSQFRQAGLRDITNTFRAARSNLKDTLAQRRVLGSSFANSQFSQQAADEANAKANFEAQSYLNELDASNKLTQEQFAASTQQFSTFINQSNLEAETAANLIASNNRTAASVATAQAELDAKAAAGAGSFFGSILGAGTGGGNTVAGSIFNGVGSGIGGITSNLGFGLGDLSGATAAGATAFNAGTDAMLADAALFLA